MLFDVLAVLLDRRAFEAVQLCSLDPALPSFFDIGAIARRYVNANLNVDPDLGMARVGVFLFANVSDLSLAMLVNIVDHQLSVFHQSNSPTCACGPTCSPPGYLIDVA